MCNVPVHVLHGTCKVLDDQATGVSPSGNFTFLFCLCLTSFAETQTKGLCGLVCFIFWCYQVRVHHGFCTMMRLLQYWPKTAYSRFYITMPVQSQ